MKKELLSIIFIYIITSAGTICCAAESSGGQVLTLSQAIQIALENNPAIGKAMEQEKGAEYEEKSVKSDYFPTLSADYSYTHLNDAPYQIIHGETLQVAHSGQYEWGVTLIQPLFTGYATTSRHEIAKLRIAVKEKEKQQTVLDITKGVKSAYYHLLLCRKLAHVAREAVETLSSHKKDAQLFYDRGIIRVNDLLRAKVALANAVQLLDQANANINIARADLNRWLAFNIDADTRIIDIDTVHPVDYSLAYLMETGMKKRPQLQAMELVRKTLEQTVTLEKSTYYPEVSAMGRYYQNGDSIEASENEYMNDHNALITLQAKWTFFDANKTRSKVNRAKADKRAYDKFICEVEDRIRLEIKSAYLNLHVAEKNIATAKLAVSQAEENLRITQLGYMEEVTTSTEVLDVRTDLTQAKTNYYQVLYGYLDSLATLERAIGQEPENGVSENPTK